MGSAADIITYVGVPLAIIGVAPILYTYLKTMIMGFRLRRILKTYDIEAAVNSRLLSGIIDVNVPIYELTPPPRDQPEYWNHRTTDGSSHGASWQNINWQRREIDEKTIQVHFSDRIKFPEASINFTDLVHYLGDLGVQTNPEGFWELSQKGLNVLPGTCLMREIGEDGVERPILVTGKANIEHPGTLLLRFQNNPSRTVRTAEDPEPGWIRVSTLSASTETIEGRGAHEIKAVKQPETPEISETAENPPHITDESRVETTKLELVEYLHMGPRGIIKKKLKNGMSRPVEGLPYWFVYSILASTPRSQHERFNGRPFKYQIRLDTFYFCREANFKVVEILGKITPEPELWTAFMLGLVDIAKINAVPAEWTKDSPARANDHLDERFALLLAYTGSRLRKRSTYLRQSRQESFQRARIKTSYTTDHCSGRNSMHLPFEVLSIPNSTWSEEAGHCVDYIYPLSPDRVPTSQDVCLAAVSNREFAKRVGDILTKFERCFQREQEVDEDTSLKYIFDLSELNFDFEMKTTVMCTVIILQSIADGAPYLAAQTDVASCVRKWDPVHLC